MTVVAVIPARFGSTRFPGKPLAKETGKFLIQHVYERVSACGPVERVIVGTDDERIVTAVRSFGGEAAMTNAALPSGTDRVAVVAAGLGLCGDDLVLNVQGDEPEIAPEALGRLIARMEQDAGSGIGTLAARFDDAGPRSGPGSPADPNCVKVVVDDAGRALYFSRALVPYPRRSAGQVDTPSRWLLHLGVYAFRVEMLARLSRRGAVVPGSLEESEALEQLGWLASGHSVSVTVVRHRFVGVDTPEDYAAFVKRTLACCG